MGEITTPFSYFGGKSQWTDWLLSWMPDHTHYVEVFGGSAALLFAKPPAPLEVYNDVDEGLVGFFRVLRDPDQFPEFARRVALIPYNRTEHDTWRRQGGWQVAEDPVEQAVRWFYVARASFSGQWGQIWATSLEVAAGMNLQVHKWLSAVDRLPAFHARMMRVVVEHRDFSRILQRYDTTHTLFYCDPPYIPQTRRSGRYAYEMTLADHERLVAQLLTLHGMVLLSGYRHPCYQPLEASGWRRMDRDVPLRALNRGRYGAQRRTESLWVNPAILAVRPQQMSLWEEHP